MTFKIKNRKFQEEKVGIFAYTESQWVVQIGYTKILKLIFFFHR